jgi:hypothetical protein
MNLVIAPAGDKSLHYKWIEGKPNFEMVLLYYGDDKDIAKSYTKHTPHVYAAKGFKWWLIKSFVEDNIDWVSQFEYIWFPDDDIEINTEGINKLFEIDLSVNDLSDEASREIFNYIAFFTIFIFLLADNRALFAACKYLPV